MNTEKTENISAGDAATAGLEFVITRIFEAPRDLVWKAWTERERLMQWWGPKGFTVTNARLDFRPGGVFHYGMETGGGQVMWGKFVYRDIVEPERIVWVSSFSDEEGGTTRAPFLADFPLEMLSTLTFAEDGGRTTLTLRTVAHDATEAEVQVFEGMFESMRHGWGGTLDRLAEHLEQA